MDYNSIYPQEWFTEKQFRISKNFINIAEQDKDTLYGMMVRNDFTKIARSIIMDKCHPFDEMTYCVPIKGTDVIFDVRNNRIGDFYSVIRVVMGGEHIGNIALGIKGVFTDQHERVVTPFDERDTSLMENLTTIISRINLTVGYYALSCRSNKQTYKIGATPQKENTVKNDKSNEKPRVICLRDIPTLRFSAFIEGRGSKPQHEFQVRGHIRHYKNGHEVFIKSYTKCKGRGQRTSRQYSIGGH